MTLPRTTTVKLTDADRGTVDYDRGVDLRVGWDTETQRYVRHETRLPSSSRR